MLSFSWDTGSDFDPIQWAFVIAIFAFSIYRDRVRRKTLRQDADGTYVWVEWHGGERRSDTDPSDPGGEWDNDGDGDGGD
ncbi:hypothetical protein [uncultured Pelagimonas sp.]|uniref:hypothetical protein n=1 Tax=uncultured Pelagimonas sp. TaxID=1618102 RepID=UPI002626B667|nr:hypothetical protein [uncultured Pelagimonas sp.]